MKPGAGDDEESPNSQKKKPQPAKKEVQPIFYSYPLEQVFRLRETLKEAVGHEFLGKTPVGPAFNRLVELVLEILPGEYNYQTVEDSLRHLAGTFIDQTTLHRTCWRIAGNTKRLRHRKAVPPWHVQRVPEWVPAQVVSCERQRNAKDEIVGMMGFRVLAGTPAPLAVYKAWSLKYCRYLSNDFGFTRPRGRNPTRYPYSDPEQLVNLRLYLLIDPDECDKEPGFSCVAFSETMKDWNLGITRCRQRVMPGFSCRMEASPDELPCRRCPLGYSSCRAGTHKSDWVQKACAYCGREDAWFDPDVLTSDRCVECHNAEIYQRDK